MTRITKLQQLEHDVYQAYSDLDEVFAIAQLLHNYVENDTLPELNKWTVRKVHISRMDGKVSYRL